MYMHSSTCIFGQTAVKTNSSSPCMGHSISHEPPVDHYHNYSYYNSQIKKLTYSHLRLHSSFSHVHSGCDTTHLVAAIEAALEDRRLLFWKLLQPGLENWNPAKHWRAHEYHAVSGDGGGRCVVDVVSLKHDLHICEKHVFTCHFITSYFVSCYNLHEDGLVRKMTHLWWWQ